MIYPSIQESITPAPPAGQRRLSFRLFSFIQPRQRMEAAVHRRPDHSLCIILGIFLQMILLCTANNSSAGSVAAIVFTVLALVVPFGWYVWEWRAAPMGLKTSRRDVQWAARVLAAIGLSLGGFVIGLASLASPLPM
jgi:hypothetical protein